VQYRHPSVEQGSISHQGKSYDIVDGVVECPPELGQELGMTPLGESDPEPAPPSPDPAAPAATDDPAAPGDQPAPPSRGKQGGKSGGKPKGAGE